MESLNRFYLSHYMMTYYFIYLLFINMQTDNKAGTSKCPGGEIRQASLNKIITYTPQPCDSLFPIHKTTAFNF